MSTYHNPRRRGITNHTSPILAFLVALLLCGVAFVAPASASMTSTPNTTTVATSTQATSPQALLGQNEPSTQYARPMATQTPTVYFVKANVSGVRLRAYNIINYSSYSDVTLMANLSVGGKYYGNANHLASSNTACSIAATNLKYGTTSYARPGYMLRIIPGSNYQVTIKCPV